MVHLPSCWMTTQCLQGTKLCRSCMPVTALNVHNVNSWLNVELLLLTHHCLPINTATACLSCQLGPLLLQSRTALRSSDPKMGSHVLLAADHRIHSWMAHDAGRAGHSAVDSRSLWSSIQVPYRVFSSGRSPVQQPQPHNAAGPCCWTSL